MTFKLTKAALLVVSVAFFAVLALNIAIPAMVLGSLALLNWVVLSGDETRPYPEEVS